MPTRLEPEPQRSIARLDLSPARSGIFTPGMEGIDIQQPEVDRFNALARVLDQAMPALDIDQLAGVARRVLRTAATGGASPFIQSRLRRAAEMRAMAADPQWDLAPDAGRRIADLLAYIDGPAGLFPRDAPAIGRLDAALLVDIALDGLRDELEDYAAFRRYRDAEALSRGLPPEATGIDRATWQRAREDELRLEQQLRRVRGASYRASAAERVFRVC
jgi:hypothetical protein